MKKEVFDYDNYKTYLSDWLKGQERGGRGLKSAMAMALHCQPAYVTHVLSGRANFSLEQAEVLNRYLGHGESESEFFYLLVQLERAGTKNLRDHFLKAIAKVKATRVVLKDRWKIGEGMSEVDRAQYYSTWYYTAVHILLTIPKYQDRIAISERLGIEIARVAEILDFLVSTGLVKKEGDHYSVTNARIHLGKDSPEVLKHHTNWRMRTILSLERELDQELHYSSVVSLSAQDISYVKESLLKAIEHVKARVRESKEEELYAFCIDWFRV